MQRKPLTKYAKFGGRIAYIRMAAHGEVSYLGDMFIKNAIEVLFRDLDELDLPVSRNASKELRELKNKFDAKYVEGNQKLSKVDSKKLIRLMQTMQTVVFAELDEKTAFFTAEKRYNSDFLNEDIAAVIGKSVYPLLPDHAQTDVECAGKLILVEQPTAATFHLMRACECTLKQLYFSVVKRGRKKPAMWANMVQHLVDKKALNEAQKGILDIYRKGFRNPTAHPDTFYSIDQAQDLLATASQLLNLLTSHEKYDRGAT